MLQRKVGQILALILMFSMVCVPAAQADVRPPTDGPTDAAHKPQASPRLIVELKSPPLAAIYATQVQAASVNGKLDANAPDAQAYINQLRAEQAAFVSAMQAAVPSAKVTTFVNETGEARQATYQIVFNGLAIDPGTDRDAARKRLAHLPGVKGVYLDLPHQTDLYTSTVLINAPALWNNAVIGGRANGGAGIKIASMDGGVHHLAPMMNGAGYTYPAGYGPNGLGLIANNNGKIIASRAYFRPYDPPAPGDENPWPGKNGTPHGMHTSSTAAGGIVTATYDGLNIGTISGVAPKAYVMSYRVFYESINGNDSFWNTEGIAALEDIVKDRADILNNSWGGGPTSSGGEYDALDEALINAVKAGIFVSMSNGNSGPDLGTGDHPSPDYINVAASTTSGTLAAGRVGVKNNPTLQDFAFSTASFGNALAVGKIFDFSYLPSDVISPTNILGCRPWPAGTFAGKAALIKRGSCEFGVKVLNAEKAGATFVVVYNHETGGDGLINMGPGAVGNQVTIPSIFIGNTKGAALVNLYNSNQAAAILQVNTIAFQAGNKPDLIASFSSRGPGVGEVLKPDIAAPGVNIVAQGYTEGVKGEARHLGYGQASGTSMAAPHVTGAAALIKQAHPNWSPAYIKSALMSTSKYLNIYNSNGSPAQPLDMGAGRLDLTHAADPGVILNPPSLSFGQVPTATQKTIGVKVTSVASAAETYSLSTLFTGKSFTQTTSLPGVTVTPSSLTLNPGETKIVSVTFNSKTGAGFGDNQGFVLLHGATHDAHLPAWARVIPTVKLADVLIIDDSNSTLGPNNVYLGYYTNALDKLGYSYQVLDWDLFVVPNAVTLGAFKAVILFTGDNSNVLAGLAQQETDRLLEYLNDGGLVIAMGQDLAQTLGANQTDPSSPNNFYAFGLGSNWLQDSVTKEATPSALVLAAKQAPAALQALKVDLTRLLRFNATGKLTGAAETPPVTTGTTGDFALHYDAGLNELSFRVTVEPTVTQPITVIMAHIHVGAVGVGGPPIRPLHLQLQGPTLVTDSLTLSGIVSPSLNVTEVNELFSGQIYVNVHTTAHQLGEVRGQVTMTTEDNEPYIDEVDNQAHDGSHDATAPSDYPGVPFLTYAGPFNALDGTVGLLHRDQPSLERPGITYKGRSVYTTFGLEGMSEGANDAQGVVPTTQAGLLGAFLNWGWSEPGAVVISDTTASNTGGYTSFKANFSGGAARQVMAAATAQPVHYRWDFGDGSAITQVYDGPDASHTYTVCGAYTVRAEVTDSNGNVAIGNKQLNVTKNCGAQAGPANLLYMPIIRK
ncbi:MAG: S8 family serine peptidase [Caldilineaceae bacterium]